MYKYYSQISLELAVVVQIIMYRVICFSKLNAFDCVQYFPMEQIV